MSAERENSPMLGAMVSKPSEGREEVVEESAYSLHNMTGGATARVDLHGL